VKAVIEVGTSLGQGAWRAYQTRDGRLLLFSGSDGQPKCVMPAAATAMVAMTAAVLREQLHNHNDNCTRSPWRTGNLSPRPNSADADANGTTVMPPHGAISLQPDQWPPYLCCQSNDPLSAVRP
jgi:hypothetical protein